MTARGSGFVVEFDAAKNDEQSDDCMYLVTAAHVALPGYDIEATFFSTGNSTTTSRVLPATVVARNASLDLALVRTERFGNSPRPLTIATSTPEVGTPAYAHGYPASRLRGPAMTSGIVCGIADGLGMPDEYNMRNSMMSLVDTKQQVTFVVTDAAMSGGMSGGPLTDNNGIVLGVNALIRPDLRALGNYAVSADEIRSFLEHAMAQEQQGDGDTNNTYRVLLYNDPMNKRERVASILRDVAVLDDGDANKVMMEAHTTGQSTIKVLGKVEAEELCRALRKQDILVEVDRVAV
jgi:S1-C subfamily serine protease